MKRHKHPAEEVPLSVVRAEAAAELFEYQRKDPPVTIHMRCETCDKMRPHSDLPNGLYQCRVCGSENVR